MSLNIAQKNAIEFINGPCLILAGAGSGKTKVIISKIVYLINNCKYPAKDIIAVTFTNKAANEMKMRLSKYLNAIQIKDMIISTFHALGLEIIKKEIDALELNSNFSLIDEKDQIMILKKICGKEMNNNKHLLKKIIFMISYWKNKFIPPLLAQSLARSHLEEKFSFYYNAYNIYLRKSNILDFDDLICLPTILLKNNKNIKHFWQEKFSYLLVDEYQDTNQSQYELIKILTQNRPNFTFVGDDDQSIYSWRGAKPQNIFLLKKDFPQLNIIKMEHNYRSSGRILKVANGLISNNTHYIQKKLFSQLKYGKIIKIIIGENEENEAEKIVKKIISQNLTKQIKYKDYAILYRGNYQSRILEKILIKENVPYNISEKSSFFSCIEIKDLLSYLRIVINPDDNCAFSRIINRPSRKIGLITLNKLEELSKKQNKSLFQVANDKNIKIFLQEKTAKKINEFAGWIKKIIEFSSLKPLNLLKKIISDIKYEKWLFKSLKDSNKVKTSINNINTLSIWFKDMVEGNKFDKPMTISQIITKLTLRDVNEKNINKNVEDKVQLMTLHASKGLEFSSVFITGMNEGILPNHKSIDENNIEEERRLTYVGITRAKKQLFFSYCRKRVQYGRILYTQPSRFLFELPQEDLYWNQNINFKNSLKNKEKNSFNIKNLKKLFKKDK